MNISLSEKCDAADEADLELLREEIKKGLESGSPLPGEEVFAEIDAIIEKYEHR